MNNAYLKEEMLYMEDAYLTKWKTPIKCYCSIAPHCSLDPYWVLWLWRKQICRLPLIDSINEQTTPEYDVVDLHYDRSSVHHVLRSPQVLSLYVGVAFGATVKKLMSLSRQSFSVGASLQWESGFNSLRIDLSESLDLMIWTHRNYTI
jgi:hypothetical protein